MRLGKAHRIGRRLCLRAIKVSCRCRSNSAGTRTSMVDKRSNEFFLANCYDCIQAVVVKCSSSKHKRRTRAVSGRSKDQIEPPVAKPGMRSDRTAGRLGYMVKH